MSRRLGVVHVLEDAKQRVSADVVVDLLASSEL